MTRPRKTDENQIRAHVDAMLQQKWLGAHRAWWPKMLVRVDELESAALILNSGKFLSRARAAGTGVMLRDSAHGGVIAGTAEHWKNYVRLYFRPRSPTQFTNEGFRCRTDTGPDCPAPVVFLLDSKDVLTRLSAEYSDANLGAASWKVNTGSDANFLHNMPWPKVYHDGPIYQSEDKADIILHRHAEVMIPDELDLDPIRYIGCRSQAEYETLWHLLNPSARLEWKARIGAKTGLHFRQRMFVDQVTMEATRVIFHFNQSCSTRGPFMAKFIVTYPDKKSGVWQEDRNLAESLTIRLPVEMRPGTVVELRLDDRLAYRNVYEGTDKVL